MLRLVLLLLLSPFWLPIRTYRYVTKGLRTTRVLVLTLRGSLPDQARTLNVWSRLLGRTAGGLDLITLVQVLDLAARDRGLLRVEVYVTDFHPGLARADEVRAALARLRDSGKHVIVFAETLDMDSYWIGLGATQLCLMPTGSLNVTGVALEFTLLKGFLDKVGLRAQLGARGKYKSMAEMFTQNDISEANREMLQALAGDLMRQLKAAVSTARKLPLEQVDAALAHAPLRANQALQFGLVDRLVYPDELRTERDKHPTATLPDYLERLRARRFLPQRKPQVALLSVTSNIKSGGHSIGPNGARRATGSTAFGHALRRVTKLPTQTLEAVILRVDSPGGSALASDAMWRELNCAVATLKEKNIPFVVSMGNTAASGGYYVSGLAGVALWASPLTLTGSIGVVAGKYEASGLLDHLGIKRVTIGSGPRANYYSWSKPWNEDELQKLADDLDATYTDFVSKMAHARGLSFERLHDVAQGRVWTGAQASSHHLVDHLGTLFDVCASLNLKVPFGELSFWNPEHKAGLGRLRSGDQETPLLANALVEQSLGPLLDELRLANWFANDPILAISPLLGPNRLVEFERD